MKNFYPRRRWLLALLLVLGLGHARAQQRPMTVVYDENNRPSHIAREIIIRFDPAALRLRTIDDTTFQAGRLNTFISDNALEQVTQFLGYNAAAIETFKIFGTMTSTDTLSVSRTGETIRQDDHWASLVLQLPVGTSEQQTADRLSKLFPLVRYAHLNWVYEVQGAGEPNDFFYAAQQASLHPTAQYPNGHVNAENAWAYQTGKSYVRVGVFDTGIDAAHPDLGDGSVYSSVVVAGRDYLTNGSRYTIQDTDGHGTAVAGIIAARRNNATGIAGIAGGNYDTSLTQNGVQLVDLKLGNLVPTSAAISAIVEGATFSSAASGYGFGLHVMNHSWGGPLSSEALKDAMRTAYRNGCVFVASRGNGPPYTASPTDLLYPACYAENWVVSVGASGRDGQHKKAGNGNPNDNTDNTYESSYGGGVDLIAPGTNALVYTTRSQVSSSGSGQYIAFNGTSAAAPHVSGVAALVLSNQNDPNNPQNNLDGEDVQHLLKRTASDRVVPNTAVVPGYDNLTGWGLLDAGEAVLQSQPSTYKFAHANAISPANSAVLEQSDIAVVLPNSYSGNGTSLKAGEYQADVWKVTQVVAARYPAGPIRSSALRVLDVWPRNSSSTLWGWDPDNPLVTEPGVRVTSWNQNSATVEGFTYHILTDEAGLTVDKWIPVSLSSSAKLDVTFYAYKWINSVEQPISQRSTAGFASTAYPNPVSNEVSLTYENSPTGGELTVEILSGTGRSVKRQRFVASDAAGERSVQLPVTELAAGFYTYRLITDQGVSVGKFIKQ